MDMNAQNPPFSSFSVENGLPSNKINDIFQDSRQFIWVATDQGLSRFDGFKFTNFTRKEGLMDNEILAIHEDLHHRLWLLTANGKLCFLNDGSVFSSSNTYYLKKLPKALYNSAYAAKDSSIWLGTEHKGFVKITDNQLHHYNIKDGAQLFYEEKNDTLVSVIAYEQPYRAFQINQEEILLAYPDSLLIKKGKTEKSLLPNKKQFFSEQVTDILKDKNGYYWIAKRGGGIIGFQVEENKVTDHKRMLEEKTITSILEDKEGNWWLGTPNEGLLLITNQMANVIDQTNGLSSNEIHVIEKDQDGQWWIGGNNGIIQMWGKGAKTQLNINYTGDTYLPIHAFSIDKNNNKWYGTDKGLMLQNKQNQVLIVDVNPVNDIEIAPNGNLYIALDNYAIKITPEMDYKIDTIYNDKTTAILAAPNGNIWMGNDSGLVVYANNKITPNKANTINLSARVNDLILLPDNNICVATNGSGLVIFGEKETEIVTEKEGLSSDICKKLYLDQQKQTWVITHKGVNKLNTFKDSSSKYSVLKYSALNGINTNLLYDIAVDGDSIWLAASNGLTIMNYQNEQKKSPPPIFIEQLKINDRDTIIKENYKLPHHKNSIRFDYTGISYKSMGQLNYLYQMEGIDDDWQSTDQRSLQYPALAPGEYVFKVKALNENGISSENTAQISFQIEKPFWKKTFFLILMSIIALALISLLIYAILQYFKEKNELQQKISESELVALRAQMNPHFIFNSLNSIQYFITENDKKSANIYLSTFSDLIRKVLDNSKKTAVPLGDEITSIELYLELESLRFSGKFNYEIKIAPDLDRNFHKIPPLLIQPYIENAIWHGLLPKKGDGIVKIELLMETPNIIKCIIEDNGIGRAKAMEIKKRRRTKHQSSGMKNTAKRLKMLHLMHKTQQFQDNKVKIIDLYEGEQAKGTRVELLIPQIQ